MKNIRIIFTAVIVAVLSISCENAKFLDCTPMSQTTPENFYKTEKDMYMALVSCYEIIDTHQIPGKGFCQRGTYAQGLLYIMNAPSDDIVAAQSGSSNEGLEMEWANFIESNMCIRDFWKTFYVGINRCNIILGYIDKIRLDDITRTRFIAEARFMRAFLYYHLAWNFGGIPIVTSFASAGNEPRASLHDIYRFILDDLDYAYEHVTEHGLIPNVSANKYTVAAYIGRICNWLAACKRNDVGADFVAEQPLNDYSWIDADAMTAKAKAALEVVIKESPYILIDDYTNLFRETTKDEQYRECLFLAEITTSGAEGYWPNSFYLPSPASNGSFVPSAYGGRHVPTPKAFYTYNKLDPRRDHNITGRISDGFKEIIVNGYSYANPDPKRISVIVDALKMDEYGNPVLDPVTGEQVVEKQEIEHPLYDSPTQTYLPVSGLQTCPGKIRLTKIGSLQHTFQQHAFSYPLMRMADVYLMYAEALYFSGDESKAREQLDIVLKRAAKNDDDLFLTLKAAYHRDNFIDELLESRMRELIFEFSRKWDLIRFGKMDEAIDDLDDTVLTIAYSELDEKMRIFSTSGSIYLGTKSLKANWAPHKIWLPISEEQIGVNQNLSQNAGWGIRKDKAIE